MLRSTMQAALSAALLCLSAGTALAAPTAFEADVSTAIDRGLNYLNDIGSFNDPSGADDAAGLTTLALLEKRPPDAPDQPPLGYSGASDEDKARIRTSVRYILKRASSASGVQSYRDGGFLMALSVYIRSGGPDKGAHPDLDAAPIGVKAALDVMFDRIKGNQDAQGYWCYSSPGCADSSTTQLVMAGLAALRAAYADAGKPWADAARLAQLNDITKKARDAYVSGGSVNVNGACGVLQPTERAHGYNRGHVPSLQQTASGTWIQLVGGVTVNDASVQGYLRWIRNRYRYTNLGGSGGGWEGSSYWYYMWSSAKAYFFIKESQVAVAFGNINPVTDMGKLAAADSPACNQRQVNRVPADDPRIGAFGNEPAGYYAGHPADFYYDYAYSLLGYQCANGAFQCNGAPGRWDTHAEQAYAILVLLRSVGGGCLDIDTDGICDAEEDEPPQDPEQVGDCDVNNDSTLDYRDLSFIFKYANTPGGTRAVDSLAVADMDDDGRITIRDFSVCAVACVKARGRCAR